MTGNDVKEHPSPIRMTDDIVRRLRVRLPDLAMAPQRDVDFDTVLLPSAPGSDYQFVLMFADDNEASIEARLVGDGAHVAPDDYFWYSPFEELAFPSEEARADGIVEMVVLLLTHRTRIIQTRGVLFWSFKAEVESDGGWMPLLSHLALRRFFSAPNIEGRRRVYQAHAALPLTRPVI